MSQLVALLENGNESLLVFCQPLQSLSVFSEICIFPTTVTNMSDANKTDKDRVIPIRRVPLTDQTQLPADYSATPGGTLFSTTPGGKCAFGYLNFV